MDNKKVIKSFKDLDVYQNAYKVSIIVALQILPKLPNSEKYDLINQLSRSSKAVPRLIAEGFAKKHQKFGFQKYLDDAMAEANETIVGLEHSRDIYKIDEGLCITLLDNYDKIARQLFRLSEAWDVFKNKRRMTTPHDDTGSETVKHKPSAYS
ncbi:MAG: four helix bundle protein [bacterium]|nr:four helix bundle protein [bacterium]